MAMYHHDTRDTATAINEAREYLRKSVMKGAESAARGMQALQEQVIVDSLMPLSEVRYARNDARGVLLNGNRVTPQAFNQLCARAQLPVAYARKLLDHESDEVRDLAISNLSTLSRASDQIVLMRSVDGVTKGVVTDAYKRMDAKLIVGSFAERMQAGQLLPVQCDVSDTRTYVRAIMPRIYGAEYGEAICFGLTLKASDFGFGKVSVDPFAQRVWCTNRAQMTVRLGRGFSKTHRGARITEDTFALSERTQVAQAMVLSSELADACKSLLAPDAIGDYVNAIGRCFVDAQRGGQYDCEKEIAKLIEARKLSEKQAQYVTDVYKSNDRDVVPELDGRWKLSQAIAYAAQHAADLDIDQRIDLEYLAGEIVDSAPKNALPAYAN